MKEITDDDIDKAYQYCRMLLRDVWDIDDYVAFVDKNHEERGVFLKDWFDCGTCVVDETAGGYETCPIFVTKRGERR